MPKKGFKFTKESRQKMSLTRTGRRIPICKRGHIVAEVGRSTDGYCKACIKIRYQERKEIYAIMHQKPEYIFKRYQRDAKTRGHSFNLTFEQFMTFWQKPCIFGCLIGTIGLDRIDSFQGYFLGNIQPMCTTHNKMKLDLSFEEFCRLARQVAVYSVFKDVPLHEQDLLGLS